MNIQKFQVVPLQTQPDTVQIPSYHPQHFFLAKQKPPDIRGFSEWVFGSDLLSHGRTTLSSALSRFTVLFGMGRRGTNSLWPPNLNCYKLVKP